MEAFFAILGVLAVAVVFGFVLTRLDDLALFAPRSTRRIRASAQEFCVVRCRTPDGRCPLTGSAERATNCPLWAYVATDMPTSVYASPFGHLQSS